MKKLLNKIAVSFFTILTMVIIIYAVASPAAEACISGLGEPDIPNAIM